MKTAKLIVEYEIIRRHALEGIEPLQQATPDAQARMTHEFQASVETTDKRLRHQTIPKRAIKSIPDIIFDPREICRLHCRSGSTCLSGGGESHVGVIDMQ